MAGYAPFDANRNAYNMVASSLGASQDMSQVAVFAAHQTRHRMSSRRLPRQAPSLGCVALTQRSEKFNKKEVEHAIDEAISDNPKKGNASSSVVTCPQCGHPFSSQGNLNRHNRTRHLGERVFCDEPGCNQSFSQAADLRRHKRRLHSTS